MALATVGDTTQATLDVTTDRIDAFAEVSGDTSPLHLDEDHAAASMFGGRIAHGMLTAGAVSAALADLPGEIVYLSQDLQFVKPVRPGETVTVTATVVEDLGDDRVRVETVAETTETVLTGDAVVLSLPLVEQGD
ncbi:MULTISPECIES: MaoC/PaaZ C-terminal domain-containing protein [Haloferax]|uniref:Acyl dehydratase n=2 Tax=Haloferax TaxID=2251 RepID=A0A6G1Z0E5_9EURY|nr:MULTISPECIES: MaoC/PaaZ C-terminal domain-containing protein [Haloferax]KAB1187221.1 acyl dehydratase [Haloferax sp. CBA1149]MRW79861.1 acyl dehydratase [Haloferax marinisediminis]